MEGGAFNHVLRVSAESARLGNPNAGRPNG